MTSPTVKQSGLTPTVIGVILLFIGLITVVFGFGILLLILGIILIVWDQRRLKCPTCLTRGQMTVTRREVMTQERGFGIVTRQDRIRTQRGGRQENSVVSRQERVPVVRRTIRTSCKCGACGGDSWIDSVIQAEDFSPSQQVIREREIREREVITKQVLIQCRSCGAHYPQGTLRCLTCGGNL